MTGTSEIVMTGAQALIRTLRACGVDWVYGVCGGNLAPILKAISSEDGMRYFGCRHEASGPFMAAGLYASARKVGACIAELGPGTANLVGGLGMAYNNNLPVLAITSSFGPSKTSPMIGTLMELDALALTAPITKWNCQIRETARIPEIVRWALREALTGKPGPVHIEVSADVLNAEASFDGYDIDLPLGCFMPRKQGVTPELALEAARLLASAKRPVLLAGGGCVHADAVPEFREIRKRLGAVATSTQMAIGVIPTDDPDFIGHGGSLGGVPVCRALSEADVVLAVGCRFSSWLRQDGKPITRGLPAQQIIQIDQDPTMIGRAQAVSLGLVGDAKLVLQQILAALSPTGGTQVDRSWIDSLVQAQAERRAELELLAGNNEPGLHPAYVAREFGRWLPDNSHVVYDGGHTTFWTNDLTPAGEPGERFNDSGMAQLGFGTPFAHAIKAAYPERPVFNVIGDGSFGFTIQELDTARRYGLNVVHVIHNNSAWGVIKAGQKVAGFSLGGDLEDTDYAAIARAFGCFGQVVERPEELTAALQAALDSGLPAVVDVCTRHERHPSMPFFGGSLK